MLYKTAPGQNPHQCRFINNDVGHPRAIAQAVNKIAMTKMYLKITPFKLQPYFPKHPVSWWAWKWRKAEDMHSKLFQAGATFTNMV